MRLFVAEKPSLGRAIAAVLPKPHAKGEGFIRCGNGDVVSWCIGHLLEQAEPDAYNPVYKQWQLAHLPIVPQQWQWVAKSKTRKQLTVLRKLVKEADQLVHAGDPDREGQLLVDEVFDFLKLSQSRKSQIQRCLISDLNPPAVKRAIAQLRPNSEFIPLSVSALARARADWLYGINLTRAYSIKGRQAGINSVLSVGRVQTPVLGLIARRDSEIEQFVSRDYYELYAHIYLSSEAAAQTPQQFLRAKWQPSDACKAHLDEEGRVLNPKLAENVAARIAQQPATLVKLERKDKKQPAPLPYNLSALQIDAAKALSMNAKQVLDIAQSLYEKHQLITYPRSDCRYLPNEHFNQRHEVLAAIGNNCDGLTQAVSAADNNLRSKCWNDGKVSAHHAIIPTAKQISSARLNPSEQRLYQLIARQYLMQFYPAYEYADTQVQFEIGGGCFKASGREPRALGWKALMPQKKGAAKDSEGESDNQALALLNQCHSGQVLWCERGQIEQKQTQPPAPFNDATLLAAMTNIARFVEDKNLKSILKETDGLGTEATRAGIIELLFKRNFLRREGKSIRATELGKGLVMALPEQATKPDMTAHWEQQLNAISDKQLNYQGFMSPLESQLEQLISLAKGLNIQQLETLAKALPKTTKKPYKRRAGSKTKSTSKSSRAKTKSKAA